jgi:putative nucleotidyltransferase with HDIG domain
MQPQYRIVLTYLLLGGLWIFFSDFATEKLFNGTAEITFAQNLKGGLFISVTALLLFVLIRNALREKSAITNQLLESYEQTIRGWVEVMDVRHHETRDHTARVTAMTVELAKLLGIDDEERLNQIERGAILHDIGKIGTPDSVLLKPGKLDADEWAIMLQHPQLAHDILSRIDFLRPCIDIPYCHHEKWDGSGYPQGLKGEEIPLAARIFPVIDVWDALIHPRVYKSAWPEDDVLRHIEEQSGKHFDPTVVRVFLDNYQRIKQASPS